jgi:hypothetical protein
VRLADGVPTVLASTASSESDQAIALAKASSPATRLARRCVLARLALRTSPGAGGDAAVVVTLSLAEESQLRRAGSCRSTVPLAIVVLTLVLDQALRRLVYRPVAPSARRWRAGAGELAARVEVMRSDGWERSRPAVNQIARLADFNLALEDRSARL